MSQELPNKILPFIWLFIKKHKTPFFGYIFVSLFLYESISFFLGPYVMKLLIDGATNNTITLTRGLFLIFVYALSDLWFIFNVVNMYLLFNSLGKAIENMRAKLFTNSIRQSTNFFNSNFSGSLSSKINAVLNNINNAVDKICLVFRNLTILVILMIVFFFIHWVFGTLMIIWISTIVLITYLATKKISKKSLEIQNIQDEIGGLITDDFINIKNIKLFSSAAKERKKLLSLVDKKTKAIFTLHKYVAIFNAFLSTVNYSVSLTIMTIAIKMLLTKSITPGTFFLIMELSVRTAMYSRWVGAQITEGLKSITIIKGGLDIITGDVEIKNKNNASNLSVSTGRIVFSGVNFNYKLSDKKEC